MSGSGLDPYGVLGVSPGATNEEIRASFRRIVRERHPDTAPERVEDPSLRDVVDAYRMLIDRSAPDYLSPGGSRITVRRIADAQRSAGATRSPCRVCGAGGLTKQVGTCRSCGGEGSITLISVTGAHRQPCRDCRGRGHVVTLHRCEHCAGTGVEMPPDG